jgi:hypothetical protein
MYVINDQSTYVVSTCQDGLEISGQSPQLFIEVMSLIVE